MRALWLRAALPLRAAAAAVLEFEALPLPETDSEKHQMRSATAAWLGGTRQVTQYRTIMRSGKDSPVLNVTVGQIYETDGTTKVINIDSDSDPPSWNVTAPDTPEVAHAADFASILQVGGRLWQVMHFEAPCPATSWKYELAQDTSTGALSVSSRPELVDWSAYGGLWIPCSGSVTPWQSYLGGEEYEPDARKWEDPSADVDWLFTHPYGSSGGYNIGSFLRYFGLYKNRGLDMTKAREVYKPYRYGYITEVKVAADGSYTNVKHFSIGRFSHEQGLVMPDERTVYLSDDGTNRMLCRFVADTAGDLTSGRLFAAKMTQTSGFGGGVFDVEWVDLGTASDAELAPQIETAVFSDLFDTAEPFANGTCPAGFTSVNAGYGGHECLSVRAGKETLASRLEARRYAAILGATVEWRGMEGLAFNAASRQLFVSLSEVQYGMEDMKKKGSTSASYDGGGQNHVRLEYNPCGCVYALQLDDSHVATNMRGLLCGAVAGPGIDTINSCAASAIANPDNLASVPEYGMLIVAEDTKRKQINSGWTYDLSSGALVRVITTPYGSEVTSPGWYYGIGDWSYLVAVAQHPYRDVADVDADRVDETASTGPGAWVGAIPIRTGGDADPTKAPSKVPRTGAPSLTGATAAPSAAPAAPNQAPKAATAAPSLRGDTAGGGAPAPPTASPLRAEADDDGNSGMSSGAIVVLVVLVGLLLVAVAVIIALNKRVSELTMPEKGMKRFQASVELLAHSDPAN